MISEFRLVAGGGGALLCSGRAICMRESKHAAKGQDHWEGDMIDIEEGPYESPMYD